ncbi:MAG: tetratricopeptide repeat protein [bacterium]|nr:tetratricopeptide repeat protein [bacterium]
MKRTTITLCISALLAVCLTSGYLYTQDKKIRLAVSPFNDTITAAGESEAGGKRASAIIEKKFASIDRFHVREAGAIQGYINNLERVQAGIENPETLKGKSESLLVNYLTVGTISKFGGRYEIDARTVNIDDWTIVYSRGYSAKSLEGATSDISWYISEKFTRKYLTEREDDTLKKPTIAVFKFRDENNLAQKAGYSGAFAEIMNSELGSFNLITTVERTYAKALINEKALEMSGVIENDNSDDNYSIRGIEYKLVGNFRVFKGLICVNYVLYNTSGGRIVFMGSREIGSSGALRPVARGIANTIEDALNNRVGTIKITSTPAGADLYIDKQPMGKTPYLGSINKGKHDIKVSLYDYKTYTGSLNILPKQVNMENIKLEALSLKLFDEAQVLQMKGDWKGAIAAYQKFIEEYNDTAEANRAFYQKGHVQMMELKDYAGALATFRSLVKRYPDTMTRAQAYYAIVMVYKEMGNIPKAKKSLQYLLDKYGDTYAAEEARLLQL